MLGIRDASFCVSGLGVRDVAHSFILSNLLFSTSLVLFISNGSFFVCLLLFKPCCVDFSVHFLATSTVGAPASPKQLKKCSPIANTCIQFSREK